MLYVWHIDRGFCDSRAMVDRYCRARNAFDAVMRGARVTIEGEEPVRTNRRKIRKLLSSSIKK